MFLLFPVYLYKDKLSPAAQSILPFSFTAMLPAIKDLSNGKYSCNKPAGWYSLPEAVHQAFRFSNGFHFRIAAFYRLKGARGACLNAAWFVPSVVQKMRAKCTFLGKPVSSFHQIAPYGQFFVILFSPFAFTGSMITMPSGLLYTVPLGDFAIHGALSQCMHGVGLICNIDERILPPLFSGNVHPSWPCLGCAAETGSQSFVNMFIFAG